MFCVKCGKELSDDMLFCPFCGNKVPYLSPHGRKQPNNEAIQNADKAECNKHNTDISFEICGILLRVNENRIQYNELRKKFVQLSSACTDTFIKSYQNNTNLKAVLDQAPQQAQNAMQPALHMCIKVLIENGINSVDAESFYQLYVLPNEQWGTAYQEIVDKYAEIVLTKEAQAEYRKQCRENRGRWVGGGFGIEGAIKGAVTAGAMNMVAGTGYAILNGIGGIISSASARNKLDKAFSDPDTLKTLIYGLWETVFCMHIGLAKCISDFTNDSKLLDGSVTSQDRSTATSILRNIPHISDLEAKMVALSKSFSCDPYSVEWYTYVYNTYGDPTGELERLAEFFCVATIQKLKEEDIEKFYKTLPSDTEEETIEAKKRIIEYQKKICYTSQSKALQEVEEKIHEYDLFARTVNGMTFTTRQEALFNLQECKAYAHILENLASNDLSVLRSCYQDLQSYKGKLAEEYRKQFINRIQWIDTENKTVIVTLDEERRIAFESFQEAERAREYIDALSKILEDLPIRSNQKIAYYHSFRHALELDSRRKTIPQVTNLYLQYIQKQIELEESRVQTSLSVVPIYYRELQKQTASILYLENHLSTDMKIVRNARKAYLNRLGFSEEEKIYMLYDNTILKSGEKGFVLTSRGFYSTGGFLSNGRHFIPLYEIDTTGIKIKGSDLIVNEKVTNIEQSSMLTRGTIAKIIECYLQAIPISSSRVKSVQIPAPINHSEIRKNKERLRKKGDYESYYKKYGNEVDVTSEIDNSVFTGDVFNYYELGRYIDRSLLQFPEEIRRQMISCQGANNNKMQPEIKTRISMYLQACGFSGHEYMIFSLSEEHSAHTGFTVTSRGIYIFSRLDSKRKFFPLNTIPQMQLLGRPTVLCFNEHPIDLSFFGEIHSQQLYHLIYFIVEKLFTINTYFAETVFEKFQTGEITEGEYKKRLIALPDKNEQDYF